MQIEPIAHAIRSHRWCQPSDSVASKRHIRSQYSFTIATAPCAHKQGGIGAPEIFWGISGVLDGLPDVRHQKPLLWVHLHSFAWRYTKEQRIKQCNFLYDPSPFDAGPRSFHA